MTGGPGLDATPLELLPGLRTHGVGGAENLQDPLLCKQQRQGPNIGVLVLAHLAARRVEGRVADEEERPLRRCVVAVILLQGGGAPEAQPGRNAVQQRLGREVALVIELRESLRVFLYRGRQGPMSEDLHASNLMWTSWRSYGHTSKSYGDCVLPMHASP